MVTNNSANYAPTQYNVQTGGASGTLNNVAPGATSGVPIISQGASSQPVFGTAVVAGGGTGLTTLTTAYGVVCAGTTATGALQNAGAGTSGQVLTSSGPSALPVYATAPFVSPVSFNAYLSANKTGTTGNGALYLIICDTVLTNIGSAYNNATGLFTVPANQGGLYALSYNYTYHNYGVCNAMYVLLAFSSGLSQGGVSFTNPFAAGTASGASINGTGLVFATLTAGTTVSLNIQGYNQGSNSTIVDGSATIYSTSFGGYKIG